MGLRFPARAHRIPISGLRASVLPPKIAKAQSAFEEDMAVLVRATFDDVAGKVSSGRPMFNNPRRPCARQLAITMNNPAYQSLCRSPT